MMNVIIVKNDTGLSFADFAAVVTGVATEQESKREHRNYAVETYEIVSVIMVDISEAAIFYRSKLER